MSTSREDLLMRRMEYWTDKADDAERALNYANHQLQIVALELGKLGVGAMGELLLFPLPDPEPGEPA